jgi:hypothetical protein
MMGATRLACVIGLLGACSCRSSPMMPTGPMAVSGHIIDYSSGASVPNVTFRLGDQQFVSDVTGAYAATLLVARYTITVEGERDTSGGMDVRGPWTRGDLLVHGGACRARYGQISDSFSGHPIAGATVSLNGKLTTDSDGWYLSDGGCSGCGACNTTYIYVSANGYVSKSQLLGRGYSEVQRLDIPLDRGHDPQ